MEQETSQEAFEEGFAEIAGARVHYLHAGSGRPMLLIHGLVGSSADWQGNISTLAAKASVYAIDLVNMGKSQRVEGLDTGLRATAGRIVKVMDALGLAEADVVAHSYGGAVAMMLAARYPRRVGRLILFAPANPYSRASDTMVRIYSTAWGRWLAWALPYLPVPIQRRALGELYGGAERVADRCLEQIVDGLRSPATLRHVLRVIHGWFAEMARLKRMLRRLGRIPTLLVWGDADRTVSLSSGIKLHRRLRASELRLVPGGGHSVFEEMPEEANRIVLEWLARQPVARSAREPALSAGAEAAGRRTRGAAAMQRVSQES